MKKLLLVLLVALMGISSYGVLQMEAAPTSYHTEKVVVNRGDSLWGIASRYRCEIRTFGDWPCGPEKNVYE